MAFFNFGILLTLDQNIFLQGTYVHLIDQNKDWSRAAEPGPSKARTVLSQGWSRVRGLPRVRGWSRARGWFRARCWSRAVWNRSWWLLSKIYGPRFCQENRNPAIKLNNVSRCARLLEVIFMILSQHHDLDFEHYYYILLYYHYRYTGTLSFFNTPTLSRWYILWLVLWYKDGVTCWNTEFYEISHHNLFHKSNTITA